MSYTVLNYGDSVVAGVVYTYPVVMTNGSNQSDRGLISTSYYSFDFVFQPLGAYVNNRFVLFDFNGTEGDITLTDYPFLSMIGITAGGSGGAYALNGAGTITLDRSYTWYLNLMFEIKSETSVDYKLENTVISMDDPYNNFWHRSEFVLCSLALVMAIIDFWVLMARSFKRKERKIL